MGEGASIVQYVRIMKRNNGMFHSNTRIYSIFHQLSVDFDGIFISHPRPIADRQKWAVEDGSFPCFD